jgi:hypothetical protein
MSSPLLIEFSLYIWAKNRIYDPIHKITYQNTYHLNQFIVDMVSSLLIYLRGVDISIYWFHMLGLLLHVYFGSNNTNNKNISPTFLGLLFPLSNLCIFEHSSIHQYQLSISYNFLYFFCPFLLLISLSNFILNNFFSSYFSIYFI